MQTSSIAYFCYFSYSALQPGSDIHSVQKQEEQILSDIHLAITTSLLSTYLPYSKKDKGKNFGFFFCFCLCEPE